MSNSLILSIGAHGRFAGLVVPELVRRGATVRALVRNPENAGKAQANGASETAIGDLRDVSSLEAALQGVAGVFYIAPVFAPDEVDLGLHLIDAARRGDIRRFVFSSVIHPTLDLANHAAKVPVESALYSSGMEFVVLHPAIFFQNLEGAWPSVIKNGAFAQPFSSRARTAMVDYRDVAEVAAMALTADQLTYGTFELCAEDLPNREDIAHIMSEVLGRTIEPAAPTFKEWAAKAQLPYDAPQMHQLERMFAHYDAHGLMGNSLILQTILGRKPRTLRQFIEELAARSQSRHDPHRPGKTIHASA